MRATNAILNILSLFLVAAGVALIGTFFFPSVFIQSTTSEDAALASPENFDVPTLTENTTTARRTESTNEADKNEGDAKKDGAAREREEAKKETVPVPEDKTLWVTVPKMSRIQSAPIPYTVGDDEDSLKAYAGIHLRGTGFPWQEEANVYIAGHRLGYPNTNSFLAFWDLNNVHKGDEVYLTDAMGRSYTYRVFKELVVNPSDMYVTEPVEGKNIITLQTCTLPDYSQRLIVQAEKVA